MTDLAAIRARHVRLEFGVGTTVWYECAYCHDSDLLRSEWPCDTADVLAALEAEQQRRKGTLASLAMAQAQRDAALP